jgi:hypothetical protein
MTSTSRRWRVAARLLLATVVAGFLVPMALSVPAWAHGDPASHYLEQGQLYPAFGDRPTAETELELLALLLAAREEGFGVRVALVANESDLTEDPSMLARPQAYAEYVAGELRGLATAGSPVLVVTPSGYGLAGIYQPAGGAAVVLTRPAARDLLDGLAPPGRSGEELARAGLVAVRALAEGAGRPLPETVPPVQGLVSTSGPDTRASVFGGWWLPVGVFVVVLGMVCAAFEIQRRLNRRDDADLGLEAPEGSEGGDHVPGETDERPQLTAGHPAR